MRAGSSQRDADAGLLAATAWCLSQAFDVEVSGNYAYVTGLYSDSLVVVDVSNPASPSIVGNVSSSSDMKYVRDCSGCGSSAHTILLRWPSLTTLALTKTARSAVLMLSAPFLMRARPFSQTRGVTVSGSYAYVIGQKSHSLAVVDVTNPTSPSIVGSVSSSYVMREVRDDLGMRQYHASYSLALASLSHFGTQ